MKKITLVVFTALTASVLSLSAGKNRNQYDLVPRESSHGRGETEGGSSLLLTTALPTAALVGFYNNNESFQQLCDTSANETKLALLQLAVPALMKVEQVKDDGLSLADVVKASAVCISGYALKLIGDQIEFVKLLTTGDTKSAKAFIQSIKNYILTHKLECSVAAVISAIAYGVYRNEMAKKALPIVEQFMSQLPRELQASITSNSSFQGLLEEAKINPLVLQNSVEFMALLSDEQKQSLVQLLKEWASEHDPIAFLEDFN